jgi:hypothetical protein
MCCFLTNSNNDQDDEENTKAWELYVYGSGGPPSEGSRTASSGSLGAFPSGSTRKTSLGSVSVASRNSSMMPFQNGSRTPSPGLSRVPSPSRAPSLRTPSPAHSLRPLGVSRSPSIQSLNSVSSLSSGRVSPLNANDGMFYTKVY